MCISGFDGLDLQNQSFVPLASAYNPPPLAVTPDRFADFGRRNLPRGAEFEIAVLEANLEDTARHDCEVPTGCGAKPDIQPGAVA
jgi:hypothetical protein